MEDLGGLILHILLTICVSLFLFKRYKNPIISYIFSPLLSVIVTQSISVFELGYLTSFFIIETIVLFIATYILVGITHAFFKIVQSTYFK